MVSRAQRTPFADWWWTVDRPLLAALIGVMLAGLILSLTASSPVAARLGLDPFYFVHRHVVYLLPAVAVMIATSFLAPRQIRRIALVVFAVAFVMVLLTPHMGGAIREIRDRGYQAVAAQLARLAAGEPLRNAIGGRGY